MDPINRYVRKIFKKLRLLLLYNIFFSLGLDLELHEVLREPIAFCSPLNRHNSKMNLLHLNNLGQLNRYTSGHT